MVVVVVVVWWWSKCAPPPDPGVEMERVPSQGASPLGDAVTPDLCSDGGAPQRRRRKKKSPTVGEDTLHVT